MKKVLIWDLPVRWLHWLLAATVLGAFALANWTSDESPAFPWHAILGFLAAATIVARLVWGLVGTRYARFGALSLRPRELATYVRGIFTRGHDASGPGHNPAASWFAVAIGAGVAGLAVTGFLIGTGNKQVKDLHELLAWVVVGLAAVHVAGVVLHVLRTGENIVAGMITGRKRGEPGDAIASPRAAAAVMLVGGIAACAALLVAGYDSPTRRLTLPLTGTVLTIGDVEPRERHMDTARSVVGGETAVHEDTREESDDDHD